MRINQFIPFKNRNYFDKFAIKPAITRWVRNYLWEIYFNIRWGRSDLDRRPPGYQPGALTNLSYDPVLFHNYVKY